jgi:hypothetical protein
MGVLEIVNISRSNDTIAANAPNLEGSLLRFAEAIRNASRYPFRSVPSSKEHASTQKAFFAIKPKSLSIAGIFIWIRKFEQDT